MSCTRTRRSAKASASLRASSEAIVAGQAPEGVPEAEAAAYEFTHQLAGTRRVDPAAYARAKAVFGDRGLVDIVMLTGLYLTTCALLNAFEVSVPQG